MKYVRRVVDLYRAMHGGANPTKIVMTPQAALTVGLSETVQPEHDGVAIIISPFVDADTVRKGTGRMIGIFLKGDASGNQMDLRSVELVSVTDESATQGKFGCCSRS